MRLTKLCIALLLLNCCIASAAFSRNYDYYFRNMGVEDGLSQNMVYSIIQDKTGFIWFGTQDGLNRYNGIEFKIFKKSNKDPHSIGSNAIFSLLQNDDGMIWVGTANGIYTYNPANEDFTHLRIKTSKKQEITGIVRDIKKDKSENIWMAIQDEGLFCYSKGKRMKMYPIKGVNIRKIVFDLSGNIWIATYGHGIMKLNPKYSQIQQFQIAHSTEKLSENNFNDLYLLNSEQLLVGTVNRGVQLFNLTTKTFSPFLEKDKDGNPLFVRRIYKTENQELWIGTETGIYIYDLKTHKVTNLQHFPNDMYSLSDNAIHSLYQDREGGMWIGTFFGGVNYYTSSYSYFEKYYPINGENSISGKSISEFCEDAQKNIWIGTEDAGLNVFNPTTKTFTKEPVPAKNIHSLLYDNGKLWVGTFSNGLYVINLKNKSIHSYRNSSSNNSLSDDNIYSIYKDSSGKIWIGSMTGLQYYSPTSDSFVRVQEKMIKNQVNDIIEDYKGTLWIATIGDGIFSYDKFSRKWTNYPTPINNHERTGKMIICFLQDQKNRLWVGTEGAGLCTFDRKTNSFSKAITSDEGLPNDVIYKLIDDYRGNIWGTTNKGIFKLNPENRKIFVFTHTNGLLGDQFNYKSGFKSSNDKIYFGGVKGFIAFSPGNQKMNEIIPPIVINSFQIQNKEVSLINKKSHQKQSIIYTNTINIPHKVAIFSLGFSALSYISPKGNRYAYKLEGRDNDWIYPNNINQVNYSDLAPGTYIFKVKGSNSDGFWNDKGTSIKINVLPPWYRTFWAYLLYFILIVVSIYLIIKGLINKTMHHNAQLLQELESKKEKELYSAKIEFFTNITHEIRTPLSLIKAPLEEVLKNVNSTDSNWDNLSIIQRNVNRLLKLVNELLDFRKAESKGLILSFISSDIIHIINETVSRFKPSASLNGISFKTDSPVNSFSADLDPEIFTKILSNLLLNALKHAKETVNITFKPDITNFELVVTNDGDTIPEQFVEKIFEPFFKLNPNVQGTGLGLSFVKSLVELHHGSIYCDNSQKDRTSFVVTFPIYQENAIRFDKDEPAEPKTETDYSSVSEKESSKTKPVILSVEDNEEFQQFLSKQLSSYYHVLLGHNGKEALEILNKENVDIVVCDIMMPVMDGLELCKIIKENIKFSHIPIILLTAKTTLISKIEGLKLGADEYIEKPYSIDFLIARIDNLLENRKKIRETYKHSPELAYQTIAHTKVDEEFLNKLVGIIHERLEDFDLDVDKLAEEMNISRATLYRKVKSISELTPNDFILLVRLKKAAELFKEKKYRVNEVAYIVGFSSSSYFSKCFYKQFGILPKDF